MKFTLEITLGNEAMKSEYDIAHALRDTGTEMLRHVTDEYTEVTEEDSGRIYDANGNRVGVWHFTK